MIRREDHVQACLGKDVRMHVSRSRRGKGRRQGRSQYDCVPFELHSRSRFPWLWRETEGYQKGGEIGTARARHPKVHSGSGLCRAGNKSRRQVKRPHAS